MQDSGKSLKTSVTRDLAHSIEMVSLRASALAHGRPYTNLERSKGKQELEAVEEVEEDESAAAMSSAETSPGTGGDQPPVSELTTLQLCEAVAAGEWSRVVHWIILI